MSTHLSPRRPEGGNRAQGDRTRAKVIDETVRCVLEEGFQAASANHITERAGVTWGVIQYHFGGRDGLLMAVVDQGYSILLDELQRIAPTLASVHGRDRIILVVDTVWEAFSSSTAVAALEILIATRTGRDMAARLHLREILDVLSGMGQYIVRPGQSASLADTIGTLMWSSLEGTVLTRMVIGRNADSSRERNALIEAIVALLAAHRIPP